jgi:hypothetical protein
MLSYAGQGANPPHIKQLADLDRCLCPVVGKVAWRMSVQCHLVFPLTGNAAGFVGQVFNLRPGPEGTPNRPADQCANAAQAG